MEALPKATGEWKSTLEKSYWKTTQKGKAFW
jgi:hypothetical protein